MMTTTNVISFHFGRLIRSKRLVGVRHAAGLIIEDHQHISRNEPRVSLAVDHADVVGVSRRAVEGEGQASGE